MNKRNTVLALFALGALPLTSLAQQQGKLWRIGFLSARARPSTLDADVFGAFLGGMRNLGYLEGKTVQYEWRFADGKYERLPTLAAELVQLKVDLIVAATTPSALAAKEATKSIPIVMVSVGDPIGSGLVTSLARPGGNITGIANIIGETSKKQLERLFTALPRISRVAVLLNPDNQTSDANYKSVHEASKMLGVRIFPAPARTPDEIERAFSVMRKERAEALLVLGDSLFFSRRDQIAQLATKAKLPSVYGQREHAEAGGLMSYGANVRDIFRRAAIYVDKILKGTKPADIPVEQPNTVELVINLMTAKALGITIPQELLFRADEVIQ